MQTATRTRCPRFTIDELECTNLSELARNSGISLRSLLRWKKTGIPFYSADRIAISLGVHPATIWTDWYDA